MKAQATPCPVCDELIEFMDPAVGQECECPDCGELFIITSLTPLELAYAYDRDDEGEFYDEDWPRL